MAKELCINSQIECLYHQGLLPFDIQGTGAFKGLRELCYPNVKSLDVKMETLETIQEVLAFQRLLDKIDCRKVEDLRVSSPLFAASIRNMPHFNNVKKLEVSGNLLGLFCKLPWFQGLEQIALKCCVSKDKLSKLCHLKRLHIDGGAVRSTICDQELEGCRDTLQELKVEGCYSVLSISLPLHRALEVVELKNMAMLRTLDGLPYGNIRVLRWLDNWNLDGISRFTRLKELRICARGMAGFGWLPVGCAGTLEILEIKWCRLVGFGGIGAFKELKELDCDGFADKFDWSQGCPPIGLTQLRMNGYKRPQIRDELLGLKALKRLGLTHCKHASRPPMLCADSVQEVDLTGCGKLKDLKPLEGLDGLKVLNLDWCGALEVGVVNRWIGKDRLDVSYVAMMES